jgi:murein tripeptide amidase MpaA
MTRQRSIPRSPRASAGLFLSACVAGAACSSSVPAEEVGSSAPQSLAPRGPRSDAREVLFARIHYRDSANLALLAEEVDLLETADRDAGWVGALLDPAQYDDLVARGYAIDVVEREVRVTPDALSTSGIPGYPCYRTVEETEEAMSALAADHPGLAKVVDIGDSWLKIQSGGSDGYDLRVLVLTSGAHPGPRPAFFLMGAIHAREYVTAETALRFAEQMAKGYGTDPDATWLLDNFELHVLPQANPDGRKLAESGYYQRKNRNGSDGGWCSNPPTPWSQSGTDLNRNSSFHWGGVGASSSPCNEMFRGQSAGSDPETQAIEAYLASIFPDQRGPNDTDAAPSDASGVFLSLHAYSPKVLFPWAWTQAGAPNGKQLQTLGRKFGFFNHYQVCQPSTCLYPATGSTDDWAYGELGVASFTFEMGTTFFQSCSSFEGTVGPDNLPALLYAFKAARRPYQAPAGPDSLGVSVAPTAVSAGATVILKATADDTRSASNGYGQEPSQSIVGARYSVDRPSWDQGANPVKMGAADGVFNSNKEGVTATIDTAGWAPGRHLLMVESLDAAGNWGVPSAVFLTVQ